MQITYNGQTYRVRFIYRDGNKIGGRALARVHKKNIVTEAIISLAIPPILVGEKGFWPELGYGASRRDTRDKFIKANGRRIALQRALKSIDLGKDFNMAIWTEYARLHADGKLIKLNDTQTTEA